MVQAVIFERQNIVVALDSDGERTIVLNGFFGSRSLARTTTKELIKYQTRFMKMKKRSYIKIT
jgi:hypothetical protein